jgi:hypothetical protein
MSEENGFDSEQDRYIDQKQRTEEVDTDLLSWFMNIPMATEEEEERAWAADDQLEVDLAQVECKDECKDEKTH